MTVPDDDYIALGRALAALRRQAGLTQAQAGKQAGIRNTHVSAVERGERGLSYRTLLALLRAYGVGMRKLVEEIERVETE
ncbi:MAG: helix-turn-helix transcriptional regulator [Solirubrobacteraceae bacterium]|jgi:transcriptional regulator with XRE-family HTH domain